MNSWSAIGNADTDAVMNIRSLRFLVGNKGATRYTYTNKGSIVIELNSHVYALGYMAGYGGYTETPNITLKNEVVIINNDSSLYRVDVSNFDEITPHEIVRMSDEEFDDCTDIVSLKNLAQYCINYREKMKHGQEENMPISIKTINEVSNGFDKEALKNEMISKIDKKTFTNVYANYLGDRNRAVSLCESFINDWAESKYLLYIALGNNIEIVQDFEYEMTNASIKAMAKEIMNEDAFGSVVNYMLSREYGDINPRSFYLDSCDPLSKLYGTGTEFSLSGYLNACGIPDNHSLKKNVDRLLGQSKANGKMHLSIDPIAYLMHSTNKHNWTSCHGWTGGTSQGSVSYALDKTSIVSFLCNEEKVKYKKGDSVEKGEQIIDFGFQWFSMKNRMMVYLDSNTNVFQTSRLYPQGETWEEYEKFVRNMLEESISEVCGIENNWKINRKAMIADQSYGLYNDGANGFNSNVVKHKDYTGVKPSISIGTEEFLRNSYTR